MRTLLVLDSQPAATVHKILEGLNALVIVVNEISKARYVLLNFSLDVWLCDLEVDELDFPTLRGEAMGRNPSLRVLLTGPNSMQRQGKEWIKQHLARAFVAKPWQPLSIKHALVELFRGGGGAKRIVIHPPGAGGRIVTSKPRAIRFVKRKADFSGISLIESQDERYRLDELLGEGGTGRVYRAFDQLLDMEVAVKLLNPELSHDAQSIQSLKDETRICLQLLHKHIVRIYNFERRHKLFMIVMEFVRGYTLNQLMTPGKPLPPVTASQVITVLVDALAHAHKRGVLHKDLTPGNVMVSDDGLLKIIDFGIADVINRQHFDDDYVTGTPVYMSPEQLRGEPLDVGTDVYSLGVLAYQILTGQLPHPPETPVETLAYSPHPPLQNLPPPLVEPLEIATALDPSERWPDIYSFGEAFHEAFRQCFPVETDDEVEAISSE